MPSWIESGADPLAFVPGYVANTDLNGINTPLHDLADRVDDSSWTTLSANASWTVAQTIQCRQVGPWVELRGTASRGSDTPSSAAWNGTNVVTLPAAMAPSAPWIVGSANNGLTSGTPHLKVDTDGGVQVRNAGPSGSIVPSGSNWSFCTVFLAG